VFFIAIFCKHLGLESATLSDQYVSRGVDILTFCWWYCSFSASWSIFHLASIH